jgi:hypothetical protein
LRNGNKWIGNREKMLENKSQTGMKAIKESINKMAKYESKINKLSKVFKN